MIQGRFGDTSKAPYVEGRVTLPRLNITSHVSFLVDTGSDCCLLHPVDSLRMNLDWKQLDWTQLAQLNESIGIGGLSYNWPEKAQVVFTEPNQRVYVYNITIEIAEPNRFNLILPSILGRDILNRWKMTYAPSSRTLAFEVVTADEIIPLSPSPRST